MPRARLVAAEVLVQVPDVPEASASVCVLRQVLLLLLHLLPLAFLCHGLLPSSPVEGPLHSSKLGSSPLLLSLSVVCC